MKAILILSLCAVALAGVPRVPSGLNPLSDEMINAINGLGTSWKVSFDNELKKKETNQRLSSGRAKLCALST